jgi:hypothetical protein
MTAQAVTATVERTYAAFGSGRGWKGVTSTGRRAYITDGQAWWFAEDFGENGRLSDAEQSALDCAAMKALRGGKDGVG